MLGTLLALCARDVGSDQMYAQLDSQLHDFADQGISWEMLIHKAEHHGLAPLLFKHVQALGFPLPRQVRRILQSLTLRARQASRIRNEAVATLLHLCREEKIEVILAKGIALANLIYSDPGLRPMRDVDLLVGESDLPKMKAILAELGYSPDGHDSKNIPDDYYHLAPMTKIIEGMAVTIEVHRNLLPYHPQYPRWPLEKSRKSSVGLTVGGFPGCTLCLEDMLWHVYLHGFKPPLTYEPLRLIHVADICSLVEQRLEQIDWGKVKKDLPAAREILSSFHCLTPWTEPVVQRLQLDDAVMPGQPGESYRGWPFRSLRTTPYSELPGLIRDTLRPSQWWMQVYYGCLPGQGLLKARWFDHPLMLYRWMKAYWLQFLRTGRQMV